MTMWLGISNSNSNSNSKQGQGQGAAVVAMVLVCVCTISISMSMLPLATSTIHHEGGAQSQGAPGANPNPNPNPANLLVALVNADRAAARLPTLRISKGLGCMALQYISRCTANSASVSVCAPDGTLSPPCHPPETDITEVYAANCGVELPTVDVISLSGRILGCTQSSEALHIDTANATVVRGREHAQVGAGVHRGRFWCLLFSSGSPNSTFLLEAAGRGIAQEDHGCFSDPDVTLSCTTSASASAGHHQTTRLAAFAMPLLLLLLLLL